MTFLAHQFHRVSATVITVYLCPSSTRRLPMAAATVPTRNDRATRCRLRFGFGLRRATITAPTVYTDIGPIDGSTAGAGSNFPATPFPGQGNSRAVASCMLGKTRVAEVTDGTSNTIVIGEDAGRDPRYLSPYYQDVFAGIGRHRLDLCQEEGRLLGRLRAAPISDHRSQCTPGIPPILAVGGAGRILRRLRHSEQQGPAPTNEANPWHDATGPIRR